MTNNKKTRSQVLKELEEACAVINEHAHGRIDVADGYPGNFLVSHYDEDGKFTGNITGHIPFTPDPDSKVQALDKAFEYFKSVEYPKKAVLRACDMKPAYQVTVLDGPIKYFPFAAEPKPEAPPKGTPVEDRYGEVWWSLEHFNSDGWLAVSRYKDKDCVTFTKIWNSLTTDHKSADWGKNGN